MIISKINLKREYKNLNIQYLCIHKEGLCIYLSETGKIAKLAPLNVIPAIKDTLSHKYGIIIKKYTKAYDSSFLVKFYILALMELWWEER